MNLKEKLAELKEQGLAEIKEAKDLKKINDIRVSLLGKKGPITEVLRRGTSKSGTICQCNQR